MRIKKNLALILGLAIPVGMIIFVVLTVYFPQFGPKPQFNFLYSASNNSYSSCQSFSLENGVLTKKTPTYPIYNCKDADLYIYDVKTHTATLIPLETANTLKLNPNSESPDGFTVRNPRYSFFPFFWDNQDYYAKYLQGPQFSQRLNIPQNQALSFTFIAWIK